VKRLVQRVGVDNLDLQVGLSLHEETRNRYFKIGLNYTNRIVAQSKELAAFSFYAIQNSLEETLKLVQLVLNVLSALFRKSATTG